MNAMEAGNGQGKGGYLLGVDFDYIFSDAFGELGRRVAYWAGVSLCVVLLLVVLVAIARHIYDQEKAPKSGLKKKSRKGAIGIIFGRVGLGRVVYKPIEEKSHPHVIVWGGSGSGKTSALLIPTLRSWCRAGTTLCVDISGDINVNVPDPGKIVFEPENINTTPYSPFALVDMAADGEGEKIERLQQLSYILIPDSQQDSDVTAFYKGEGRKMLQGALVAYYTAGMDFCAICRHILGCDYQLLIDDVMASGNEFTALVVSGFEGVNEKTLASVKSEVDKAVQLFGSNEKVSRSVRRPADGEQAISPATLENKSVFMVIKDEKLEIYAPLFRLITAQTLEYIAMRRNNASPKILLALDEFSSLCGGGGGKIDITPALRKARKKGVYICLCTQSLSDLTLVYGEAETRAMLENLAYKVVMSAADYQSMKYYSELAGERVVEKKSTTTKDGTQSETVSETREKVLHPEDFSRLGDDLILFHPGGEPLRLKKNYYFR